MKLNRQDNCVRKSCETEGLILHQYNVEYAYICFIYPRSLQNSCRANI